MNEEALRRHLLYAGPAKPSMLRRCATHDYRARSIYMVTLTTADRRHPWLGRVTGSTQAPQGSSLYPHISLSPLGAAVRDEWLAIPRHHPEIELLAFQIMPDHLHGIIFVKETMPRPLGMVIAGFKTSCNKAFRRIILGEDDDSRHPVPKADRRSDLLWSRGYNDRLLSHEGQLQRWTDYIHQNPYRLQMKREHPDLFRIQRDLHFGPYTFAAIGNRFLLSRPYKLALQCSRSLTPEQTEEKRQRYAEAAAEGAVVISPAISPGEKAIMRSLFDAGRPLVYLQENGFAPLAKPGGRRMEACALGRLLILAPWQHHNERQPIQRAQCLSLNAMAAALAGL